MLKEDTIQGILKTVREELNELPNGNLVCYSEDSEQEIFEYGNMVGRNQAIRVLADILYNMDSLK